MRLLASAALALAACTSASPPAPTPAPGTARVSPPERGPAAVERAAVLMGTDIRIVVLTEDAASANEAIDAAVAEMSRIEELMTDWKETSQLSAINRAAGKAPVVVEPELLDLLAAAREVGELTGGKFDVTYAGAGRLWDFKAPEPRLPDPAALRAGTERVDYTALRIDLEAGTAFLERAGMRLGLGGIAKGYAVDRALEVLAEHGFSDYAVNAGGDLAVRGRRGDELWSVSIRHPRQDGEFLAVLPVSNASVVTSGDYERYFELDGKRYAHILDPQTGWPADGCQSVTVLAQKTWLADALATGVFVLGPEAGMALVESLEGVEAMLVDAEGKIRVSTGLAGSD